MEKNTALSPALLDRRFPFISRLGRVYTGGNSALAKGSRQAYVLIWHYDKIRNPYVSSSSIASSYLLRTLLSESAYCILYRPICRLQRRTLRLTERGMDTGRSQQVSRQIRMDRFVEVRIPMPSGAAFRQMRHWNPLVLQLVRLFTWIYHPEV